MNIIFRIFFSLALFFSFNLSGQETTFDESQELLFINNHINSSDPIVFEEDLLIGRLRERFTNGEYSKSDTVEYYYNSNKNLVSRIEKEKRNNSWE